MISLSTTEKELMPTRQTKWAAAYDLHAADSIKLEAYKPVWVPTGAYWTVTPPDIVNHAIIYMRSKFWTEGIICHSSPIDADFENEIKVGMRYFPSLSDVANEVYHIDKGERIAQLVIYRTVFIDGEDEVKTFRTGGFGSTD